MHATTAPVSPLAPYGATLLRLALGVLFLVHALTKLLVFTPAGTAAFFESLGLPGVLGYLTLGVELVITVALLLGIYARWVGLVGVPLLLGIPGVLGAGAGGAVPGRRWQVDPAFALIAA